MQKNILILILAVIGYLIYFLSPIDLIPDFTGLFGRLDDLAFLIFLVWLVRKEFQRSAAGVSGKEKLREEDLRSAPDWETSTNPYQILGVSPEVTSEEIKKVYQKLAALYHPDKVTHLGKEFQELAHKKFVKIQWAYDELMKQK